MGFTDFPVLVPMEEVVRAFNFVIEKGWVRNIGLSFRGVTS